MVVPKKLSFLRLFPGKSAILGWNGNIDMGQNLNNYSHQSWELVKAILLYNRCADSMAPT